MIEIYAPSYKRAKGVKTHKILPSVIYVVHEFEEHEYRAEGHKITVIPNDLRGNLSRVRNHIAQVLLKNGGIMIDDDIEDFKLWDFEDKSPFLKSMKAEDILEFFEIAFVMAQEAGYKLFGVNIIGDKGSYREYTPLSFTNYISGSLMGIIPNPILFDENLPLKEDYDYCLQHFNKYRGALRFNYIHMIKKDHGNIGGCSDNRTIERECEQMKLFQRKWGSKIVRLDNGKKKGKKKETIFDINPVIKVPIKGV